MTQEPIKIGGESKALARCSEDGLIEILVPEQDIVDAIQEGKQRKCLSHELLPFYCLLEISRLRQIASNCHLAVSNLRNAADQAPMPGPAHRQLAKDFALLAELIQRVTEPATTVISKASVLPKA